MKRKFKKLVLSTETLRNLNTPEVRQVAGGGGPETGVDLTCMTCTKRCTDCTVNCTYCTAGCTVCCI